MLAPATRCLRVLVIAAIGMTAWGCGDGPVDEVDASTETEADATASTGDPEPESGSADFELFTSDEGAGCSVYIAVPAGAVDDETDLRAMLWDGVVDTGFTTCGFSEVVEAGLITVGELDSYGQPDWTTVTEHGFFGVDGWDGLLENCGAAPLPDSCSEQVRMVLTQ